MPTLLRRSARTAALAVAAGAATLALTAPAAADPVPLAAGASCSAPLDGVTVCMDRAADPSGYNRLTARLVAEPGHTITAGFVSIDGCGNRGCRPLLTTAGTDTALITTGSALEGKGASYVANASWVDGDRNRHLGASDRPPPAQ